MATEINHVTAAKLCVDGKAKRSNHVEEYLVQLAQAHALIAIAESLKVLADQAKMTGFR